METQEISNESSLLKNDLSEDENAPRTYVLYDPEAVQDEYIDEPENFSANSTSATIHDFAELGDVENLRQLVSSGINVDTLDGNGLTALQCLCKKATVDRDCEGKSVRFLLDHGANIGVLDANLNSLLHLCVQYGNEAVLELLLKNDVMVDPNLVNKDGETALQLSARVGQLKCLQCLVLNARPYVPPVVGPTSPPVHRAGEEFPVPLKSPQVSPKGGLSSMPTRPRPNVKALVVNAEAPLTSDHSSFNEISPFPHLSSTTPSSTKASSSSSGAVASFAAFASPSPRSPAHSLTMSVDMRSRSESSDEVQAAAALAVVTDASTSGGDIGYMNKIPSSGSILSGSSGALEVSESISGSEKTALSKEQKRMKLLASLKEKEKQQRSDSAAWMQYEHIRDQGLLEDSQSHTLEGGAVEFIKQQYGDSQNLTRQMRSNVAATVFSSSASANAAAANSKLVADGVENDEEVQRPSLFAEYVAPLSEWVECYTAAGEVYYYNSKTEVVQWENPHEPLTGPASSTVDEAAAPVESNDSNQEAGVVGVIEDYEETPQNQSVLDTSLQYSTNTEYPEDSQYYAYDEEGGGGGEVEGGGGSYAAAVVESVFSGLDARPSDTFHREPLETVVESSEAPASVEYGSEWMECYTEEGDLYYYNTVTQATQWENPHVPVYSGEESYDYSAAAYEHTAGEVTTAGAQDFFASGVAVTDYSYMEGGTTSPVAAASGAEYSPGYAYDANQVFQTTVPSSVAVSSDPAQSTTPPLPSTKRRGMATRTISVDASNQVIVQPASAAPTPSPVTIDPAASLAAAQPPVSYQGGLTAGPPVTQHPYQIQDPNALRITTGSSLPSPQGYGLDSPALRDYHDSRDKPTSPQYASAAASPYGGANNGPSAFTPHHRGISIDKKGLRQRVGSSHSVGSVVSMSSLSDQSVDVDDGASGIAGLVSPDDSRRRAPLLEPEAETMSMDDSNNASVGDDNTSTATNNTERHLEIWSRFFENAFTAGGKREAAQKQQRRKAEKNKRQSSAKAIVDKSGAVLDNAGKTASSNKWPSALSDKRYRALITLAVSRSSAGSAAGVDDENGEDVDTTGIDLSILSVALLAAVTQNDLSTVEELLQAGANPNCVDDQVRSPAHHAAKTGNAEMMALLFDQGADLEMVDQVGRTPLHIAALFGREAVAEFLLACAVDVDGPVDHSGNTPLHLSARGGHASIVRLLLQFGASTKVNNSGGMTALEIAQTMQPQTSELMAVAAALQGRVSPREFDKRRQSSREKSSSSAAAAASSKAVDKLTKMQSIMKGDQEKNQNPVDDRTSRKMDLLKQQAREKLQIKDSSVPASAAPQPQNRKTNGGSSRPSHVVNPNISDDSDEEGVKGGPPGRSVAASAAPPSQQLRPAQPVVAQSGAPKTAASAAAAPPAHSSPATSAPAPIAASSGHAQRRYEKFAEDSGSDPSSGEEDEGRGGGGAGGGNLIATSVWGVATTLIDMSLSMFSTGSSTAAAPPPTGRNSGSTKGGGSSKTSPPPAAAAAAAAAAPAKSSGLSWFSRRPSVEDENQAAIERLIGGGGPTAAAPPTDSELYHKGLGFHATPPDIVARELAARAGQIGPSGGAVLVPPSEVQVAVAMARAESLRHSPNPYEPPSAGGLHLSSSVLSTSSFDDASSVGSPTAGRTAATGAAAPIGSPPNGYSIGASLPKGVSWRYVDVLNQK